MTHLSTAGRSAGILLPLLLLGAADATAQATQNYGFNDYDILLRSVTDTNHGLGYYGGTKLWNGTSPDGPVLYGYTGGILGINRGGTRSSVLTWTADGQVGIGTSAPGLLLHLRHSSMPGLRLEWAGGSAPQTWDVASSATSFFVRDVTNSSRTPFRIQAGAPENAFYLNSNGWLGLGTGTPMLQLHLNKADTPGVRLEQTNSGGFTAQTWDVAGNEANFFVRDMTGGSRLPFRIRPGAPTSSIDISAAGNVGIGTANPQARLDVQGSVKILGANTLEFGSEVAGKQADAGTIGYGNITTDALNIVGAGTSTTDRKVAIFSEGGMTVTGNLTLNGVVSSSSDARLKTDLRPLQGALAGVQALQGHRYRFRPGKGPQGEQLGFVAQELEQVYPELVSTGADGLKAVNYAQLTPVLVEALKEQQRQLEQLRAELTAAQAQLRQQQTQAAGTAALETRLQRLESLLGARAARP